MSHINLYLNERKDFFVMVNTKRLITPIISIGVGFLTFMFMIMNYFAAELVGSSGSSAYESIGDFFDLNDSFLANYIDGAFLTIFTAILLIFLIIMAIVLLAVGVLGLVKEFTHFDLFADPNKLTSISKLTLKIYLIIDISAAVFYVVFCAVNTFDLYIPGLGVWFLVALGVGGFVANNILSNKFAAEISASAPASCKYKCSSCGASAKASERFCSKCGSPVIMVQPTAAAGFRCSSCASPANAGEKFCSKCGSPVVAMNSGASAQRFCPTCGKAVNANDRFCATCGTVINP